MNSENEKLRALLQQALDMLEEQALHIEAEMQPSGKKLLNQIRAALSQQAEQPPVAWLWEYLGTHLTADKEQADWLQSNGVELQALYAAPIAQAEQWISVETRLPEIKKVLSEKCILEGREVPTLYRSGEVIKFDGKRVSAGIMEWFHGKLPLNGVTHWLPLPSPPTP